MEPQKTDPSIPRPPMRLLLVEDHEGLAEVTAEFLHLRGLEVRISPTGRDALEVAETFRPEIVLCDLNLPDVAGLDLAKALRDNPATQKAFFVIHTGLTDADIGALQDANIREVDLFLSKPMTQEKLDRLLQLLRSRTKNPAKPEN